MSATATWSAETTPLAYVAGAVVHTLGLLCIVHAAATLALGGAAWNLSAHACMGLAALLAVLQLRRRAQCPPTVLRWDPTRRCLTISDNPRSMMLTHAWHGPGWMTLGLRPHNAGGPVVYAVIWKSRLPAPFWNELVLRVEADQSGEICH